MFTPYFGIHICVCVCVFVYTHTGLCIHIYIYIYIYIYIQVYGIELTVLNELSSFGTGGLGADDSVKTES